MSRTRRRLPPALSANEAVTWVIHPSLASPIPTANWRLARVAARRRLDRQLRRQGRTASPAQVHRGAEARQPSGQCRRRQDARHPSREHDASADERGSSWPPRGSARRWSAFRWGWRPPRTSSPISSRPCAPHRGTKRGPVMRLPVDRPLVFVATGGPEPARIERAARRFSPRRGDGSQRLGADRAVGSPTTASACSRSIFPGTAVRKDPRIDGHRRDGGLDRAADRGRGPRSVRRWSGTAWALSSRSRRRPAIPTGSARMPCSARPPRCRCIPIRLPRPRSILTSPSTW